MRLPVPDTGIPRGAKHSQALPPSKRRRLTTPRSGANWLYSSVCAAALKQCYAGEVGQKGREVAFHSPWARKGLSPASRLLPRSKHFTGAVCERGSVGSRITLILSQWLTVPAVTLGPFTRQATWKERKKARRRTGSRFDTRMVRGMEPERVKREQTGEKKE